MPSSCPPSRCRPTRGRRFVRLLAEVRARFLSTKHLHGQLAFKDHVLQIYLYDTSRRPTAPPPPAPSTT